MSLSVGHKFLRGASAFVVRPGMYQEVHHEEGRMTDGTVERERGRGEKDRWKEGRCKKEHNSYHTTLKLVEQVLQ